MSKQYPAAEKKRTKKQERREEQRQQALAKQRKAQRQRILIWSLITGAAVIILGAGLFYLISGSHTSTSTSPAAQTNTTADTHTSTSGSAYAPVNGVSCDSGEHYDYHHHIHVSMYINGQPVAIPQNVGINPNTLNGCLYWLHTHDTSGVIHIESPVTHTYPLGNFLDIWEQHFAQLGFPAQLNQSTGWQVYVNGKAYQGDFRQIPMDDHTLITMAYNSPGVKPDTLYNWNGL
jgi:hypothetical protein